jgi:asparagine synthase (glutamine-hydrolysing)
MCGIAGYAGTREIERSALEQCAALLEHRGPDDFGIQRFQSRKGRQVWLVNRRLRIIDLDARARQPLEHNGCWITYNGELYNYVELRKTLAADGVTFRTESDTEVLVATVAAEGVNALDGCEGMWAFALFDTRDGSLTLSRDRFGEKPLYLFRDATGVYFASEIKALRALVGHRFAVNDQQLRRYLVNGYRSLYKTGETFFQGVTELPAATCLRIDRDGRETQSRYWTPRICVDARMRYDDAVSGVRRYLERSIERRLRADVPLAFCLSSGVDSNAIAAIAKKVFDYDVHGFTVVDPDPRYDESYLSKLAARALGIRHTEVPVTTTGFLDDLRTLVRHHDGPVATISYFVHWKLMQEIAGNGYRVSVSGTAADELFTGYYDHHLYFLHDFAEHGSVYDDARRVWEVKVRPLVRNPFLIDADLFSKNSEFRDHLYLEADAFSAGLTRQWREPFVERRYTDVGVLRNRMLNELFEEVVPVILHEDDLNAMSFSIENRSPYLDRELFEFSARIPTEHLIRRGYAKAPLRDAIRDLLPAEVVNNRRKVGFNASILSLLDTRSAEIRQEVLADSPVFNVVRREAIEPLLDATDLSNSQSKFLFNFLNAKLFLEHVVADAA